MRPAKVLLVEHGTAKGGHARSNLSVLLSVNQAWPDSELYFASTQEHHNALLERIGYCSEKVPFYVFIPLSFVDVSLKHNSPRLCRFARNWYREIGKALKVFSIVRRLNVDLVVDLWSNGSRILSIKLLRKLFLCGRVIFLYYEHNWYVPRKSGIQCWIQPHTIHAIKFAGNVGHGYALLHKRMKHDLASILNSNEMNNFFDYSYGISWPYPEQTFTCGPANPLNPIRSGFVSPSFKGLASFLELVREVHASLSAAELDRIEFSIIGNVVINENSILQLRSLSELGVSFTGRRLDERDYALALSNIDFAIHLYEEQHYRTRYSSSLQDTIAFCKPAIMTRTSYTNSLQDIEPGYGFSVASPSEAAKIVKSLVFSFSPQDSFVAESCARRLRDYFSVQRAAEQIRSGYETVIASM